LVDANWLEGQLGQPGLVVLDIRNKIDGGSRQVFEAGHIPGSVYSDYLADGWRVARNDVPGMLPPVPDLERLIGGLGIGNDSHVVIVPAGVSALDYGSATRVYWTFKVLGHDAVSILNGGYKGWVSAGARDVQTGPSKVSPVTFVADFRPQLLATGEDVEAAVAGGKTLIDNRPPEQYSGKAKHPKAARAGTIPGAVNVPQDQFFDEKSGQFASFGKLSELWTKQDVAKDSDQIAFCNTGHWASLGWFAAHELLGNDKTRMYDGSMTEWTAKENRPVVNGMSSVKN
jgi:thiosulfate/3-mercaptopyruvate sulfurtransferase